MDKDLSQLKLGGEGRGGKGRGRGRGRGREGRGGEGEGEGGGEGKSDSNPVYHTYCTCTCTCIILIAAHSLDRSYLLFLSFLVDQLVIVTVQGLVLLTITRRIGSTIFALEAWREEKLYLCPSFGIKHVHV